MPNWGGGAKGAASGAGVGSIFGPIGTGIGAGVGFLGGLFGGGDDDKKKDDDKDFFESTFNNVAPQLQSQATDMQQTGQSLVGQGQGSLGSALQYFQQLLSNDGGAVMDATRMERGRVIDQYNTALKSVANFAPRGGGAVSAIAGAQMDQAASLADITSSARGDAAKSLGTLGATTAGLGLQAADLSRMDLNTLIQAALGRESLDVSKRGQTMEMWGGIGEAAGSIIGSILLGNDGDS